MQNFFDVRNITVPSNNSDAFSFVTRYLTESEINPMTKYTVDEAESINLVYDTFCEDEASVSTQVSSTLSNLNSIIYKLKLLFQLIIFELSMYDLRFGSIPYPDFNKTRKLREFKSIRIIKLNKRTPLSDL